MGNYAVGSECCNNCVHWDCHSERKFRGNPPTEVYTDSNCDKCLLTGQNTLSKSTCGMFKHIGGITRTFAAEQKHSPNDLASNLLDSIDENCRAFMQATIDMMSSRDTYRYSCSQNVVRDNTRSKDNEEDLFDETFAREVAKYARDIDKATRRVKELQSEGMDPRCIGRAKSIEFMCMYDKAKAGDARSQYLLAMSLREGSHGAAVEGGDMFDTYCGRSGLSYSWLKKSAEKGFATAEYRLGEIERSGKRLTCDDDPNLCEALRWFGAAKKHGHSGAAREYAATLKNAIGDAAVLITEFLRLISKAKDEREFELAESKLLEANYEIAKNVVLSQVDDKFVDAILEALTKTDYPPIQNVLGNLYFGKYPRIIATDVKRAYSLFVKSARSGCADAMTNVGLCYANGYGVDKDQDTAAVWYKKASDSGSSRGAYFFGCRLRDGNGVQKDEIKSNEQFFKAAAGGCAAALFLLSRRAVNGSGMNKDPELAFAWRQKAAEKGHAEAMYRLGEMFGNGCGCTKSEEKKKIWQKKAAKYGYVDNNGGW